MRLIMAEKLTLCPYDTTISQQRCPFLNIVRLHVQVTGFLKDIVESLRIHDPQSVLLHVRIDNFCREFERKAPVCIQ